MILDYEALMKEQNIFIGRPADCDSRLEKEVAVYDVLDRLGIDYARMDHEAIATIEGCRLVDKALGITICKNLFLCDRKKEKFYLLMMPGTKRFHTGEFSRQIGSSRLSFAPEEYLLKYLNVTPGSVSVMGFMNDSENKVQLCIDRDVIANEYVGCHPCINTTSLRLMSRDLIEKFLPYVKHDYLTVDLPKE